MYVFLGCLQAPSSLQVRSVIICHSQQLRRQQRLRLTLRGAGREHLCSSRRLPWEQKVTDSESYVLACLFHPLCSSPYPKYAYFVSL